MKRSLVAAGSLAVLCSVAAWGQEAAVSASPSGTPGAADSVAAAATGTDAATTGSDGSAAAAAAPVDFSQYKTADEFWAELQKLEQVPGENATPEVVMGLLQSLVKGSDQFETQYPKDARRWEAKLTALKYRSMLESSQGEQPDPAKMTETLKEIAAAPDAEKGVKEEARINLIGIDAGGQETLTPDVEKEMLAFIHDYPDEPDDAQLQKARLDSLKQTDEAKANQLLDSLLKDKNQAVVQMAQAEIVQRDLMKKPLDLSYTATDGSKVDVSKMRGKVVLVDFWATWCAPCMEEVPDVVKVYKAFHSKGLEIVGVSLDKDKSLLEAVTKAQGMEWPQFFDGKEMDNQVSSKFGIMEIPTMWLVDKKGMVVDVAAGDGLGDKVAKLLGE